MASRGCTIVKLSLVVAFLYVAMGGRATEAAVTCNQVIGNLSPCIESVTAGRAPNSNCCSGVRTLNGLAASRYDRQAVCRCLKSAIQGISLNPQIIRNAAALPAECSVNLPYKIDPTVNCDTIN